MDYRLEDVINHRISMLALFMKRQILKILNEKKLEITPDQWMVLYYLWEEDGLSVGEIAKRSKKDFANVTRIIDKLVKVKYIKKKKSEKDSRISNVFLLPKGEAVKAAVQNCWKEASDIALQGISSSEQQQLITILEKIENNILNDLE